MAVKKPTKPRKFKQARKDAKSAAKSTFSGKSQARLKDPKLRLTSDDKLALDEMKKMAKSDLGEKAYLNKKEYDAQQRAAREKFRESMRSEFGEYGGKKATNADKQAPKRTMTEKAKTNVVKARTTKVSPLEKPMPAKPGSTYAKYGTLDEYVIEKNLEREGKAKTSAKKKPATKGYSAGKSLTTEAGKARYKELIDQGVKPKSAMNKALFFESKKTGSKTSSPVRDDRGMTERQSKAFDRKTNKMDKKMGKLRAADPVKFDAREAAARNPKLTSEQKAKAIQKIGKTTKPKPASAPKSGKYLEMQTAKKSTPKFVQSTRVTGKDLVVRPKAGAVVAKEATKAAAKKGLLRTAAGLAGKAVTGKVGLALTAGSMVAGPLFDQLNKGAKSGKNTGKAVTVGRGGGLQNFAPSKPKAKKVLPASHILKKKSYVETTASGKRYLGSAHVSSAGLKNKTIVGAGGSTYYVKKGDTLSGIAKNAGVSLADVRAANPTLMKNPKYNKGNIIFANTKVKLPSKKK